MRRRTLGKVVTFTGGYHRFRAAMALHVTSLLNAGNSSNRDTVDHFVSILHEEGLRSSSLLLGFIEIDASMTLLSEIASRYIRNLPASELGFSRANYFEFTLTTYRNEFNSLQRQLRRYHYAITSSNSAMSNVAIALSRVCDTLIAMLNEPIGALHKGGHELNYKDDSLIRMRAIEWLRQQPEGEKGADYDELLRDVLSSTKSKWFAQMKENQRTIEIVLDQYFDVLRPLVFADDGSLIL